MTITTRSYRRDADYDRVGGFLIRTYRAAGDHINWIQPRWEYMHYHPYIGSVDLGSIGIWEADGEIVAVVHPEHDGGTVYVEIDPTYVFLKREMVAYAEEHLRTAENGGNALSIYINDRDAAFQAMVAEMGYRKQSECEEMSLFTIPDPIPAISLPNGFRLASLADDNDIRRLHQLLYRGFDHGDEPPEDGIAERSFMQSAPNYTKELNIVVVAPDGQFVAYCGMWYEPTNRIAYVEPVCTDPDFRRMGLASAAVLEGIRRCGERGATVAYVGSALPIYRSLGFREVYNCTTWQRT